MGSAVILSRLRLWIHAPLGFQAILSEFIRICKDMADSTLRPTTEWQQSTGAFKLLSSLISPRGAGIAQAMKGCGERKTVRKARYSILPFEGLRVLSKVEGLVTLSRSEELVSPFASLHNSMSEPISALSESLR